MASGRSLLYGRPRAVTLGVLVAVALFGALFPWFPGETRLEQGATAPRTITAPRDRSYTSEVLTAERRDEAAAAVEDELEFKPEIGTQQLAELDRRLEEIDEFRSDPSLAPADKQSAIREVAGASLSQRGAGTLASVSSGEWSELVDEAREALKETLAEELGEDDLEQARQGLRGRLSPLLSGDQALALRELAEPLIRATLAVNTEATATLREQARDGVDAVAVSIVRGEVIVPQGERLSTADIEQLDELGLLDTGVRADAVLATALLAAMVGGAFGGYLFVVQPPALAGMRRLMLFALLLLIPALAAKFSLTLLLPDDGRHFLAYALPFAAAPIAAAVLLDVTAAVLLTAALASVAAFITVYLPEGGGSGPITQLDTARMWLVVTAGSLAGIYFAATADRLQSYLAAGIATASTVGAALLAFWLLDPERAAVDLPWMVLAAGTGGLLAALIAVGAFVLLSRPFGIITRIELMERAQLNHHLLRRLQDEAPGTFQHSILVGNLAERAADRIGASALLVRVGAYYHDIGKLEAPALFVENAGEGAHPHDGIDPLEVARGLRQHVTDGIEMARREGLPGAVAQFIPQHHGTLLMASLFDRAVAEDPQVAPELFRYPGPTPRSREAALVMLADGCEEAVRTSADRAPERIGQIVDGLIAAHIEEGQFDECDISLRDLRAVADAFTTALTTVYHPRLATEGEPAEDAVDIPGATTAEAEGVDDVPPVTRPEVRLPSPPPEDEP